MPAATTTTTTTAPTLLGGYTPQTDFAPYMATVDCAVAQMNDASNSIYSLALSRVVAISTQACRDVCSWFVSFGWLSHSHSLFSSTPSRPTWRRLLRG
jgi:hypothetical protein